MNPDHELTAIARLQRGDIGGLEPLAALTQVEGPNRFVFVVPLQRP